MDAKRRCTTMAAVLAAMAMPLAGAAWADDGPRSQWIETWGASPQEPVDPVVGGTARSFDNQTIRQVARISAGGVLLRLRLTNEFGTAPVTFGSVHIALTAPNGAIVPGTDHEVTFSGQSGVTIPPAAPALSDPIRFPVGGLSSLTISLYVPAGGNPGPATPHSLGVQTAYIVSGNQTAAPALSGAATTVSRYFISGVDAVTDDRDGGGGSATLVTLGDSITDGFASTVDANHRWPDDLAARLQGYRQLRHIGVADEGISGNRVLRDGIGPNALSRLDRDVLSRPGVRFMTLLEGINDIGFPNIAAPLPGLGPEPTADQITAGYRQIIRRAHENGILIFGATLTPFGGASYQTAQGETIREAVNAFIRTSGEFDGVIDFDAATRDPANPTRLLPAYDSGDHLHPNDAGYAAMANAVDLRLFLQGDRDR